MVTSVIRHQAPKMAALEQESPEGVCKGHREAGLARQAGHERHLVTCHLRHRLVQVCLPPSVVLSPCCANCPSKAEEGEPSLCSQQTTNRGTTAAHYAPIFQSHALLSNGPGTAGQGYLI